MVISALGIDKTLNYALQGITQYGAHNLIVARVGISGDKKQCTLFRGADD